MKTHFELIVNTLEPGADLQKSRLGQAAADSLDGPRLALVRPARDECRRDAVWHHSRVAIAAYYLAEHRGFQPGWEAADWRRAERQIDAADEIYG